MIKKLSKAYNLWCMECKKYFYYKTPIFNCVSDDDLEDFDGFRISPTYIYCPYCGEKCFDFMHLSGESNEKNDL